MSESEEPASDRRADPDGADTLRASDRTGRNGLTPRPKLPRLPSWLTDARERLIARLAEVASSRHLLGAPFSLDAVFPVLDRLAGIAVGLAAMVIVDRHYGPNGLGVFAWFFSLLTITGYLARCGAPMVVENRLAREPGAMTTETV